MAIIKQISLYNGSSWDTDDIGAKAKNISLDNSIVGYNNVEDALSSILPTSQFTASKILATDSNRKIIASNANLADLDNLQYLSGITSNIQTQIDTLNNKFGSYVPTSRTVNSKALSSNISLTYSDVAAAPATAITNITRSGLNFTATRANGTTFTFNQQDNNTTYGAATTSAAGLMTAAMVTKLNGIAVNATKNAISTSALAIRSAAATIAANGQARFTLSTLAEGTGKLVSGEGFTGLEAFTTGNGMVSVVEVSGFNISTSSFGSGVMVIRNPTSSAQSATAKVWYRKTKIV